MIREKETKSRKHCGIKLNALLAMHLEGDRRADFFMNELFEKNYYKHSSKYTSSINKSQNILIFIYLFKIHIYK